jgi:DNA-binding transcriptional regulator YiaG
MRKASFLIELSPSDRARLEKWESAQGSPQQVALRCRIILMALAGEQNQTIAARLGVSRPTVNLWRKMRNSGIEKGIAQVVVARCCCFGLIINLVRAKPKGMTHWSCG